MKIKKTGNWKIKIKNLKNWKIGKMIKIKKHKNRKKCIVKSKCHNIYKFENWITENPKLQNRKIKKLELEKQRLKIRKIE